VEGDKMKVIQDRDGFFGIGIMHGKRQTNLGTLWRSAYIMGASFIFTIDHKYKHQCSDVQRAWTKIPLFQYDSFDAFYDNLPYDCQLIGLEMDEKSEPIRDFKHPKRCVYLLGCEANGLGQGVIDRCHKLIYLPGEHSLNVSVAGSIAMYDRINKA